MEEIGLFEPDLTTESRPAGDVITVGKDSIYRNVDAFRKRIKDQYCVRDNLQFCLRGAASRWWTYELSEINKKAILNEDFSNGQFACATGFGRTQLIFIPGPVLPNLSLHPSAPFVNIIVDVYYPAGPSVEIDGHASRKRPRSLSLKDLNHFFRCAVI